MSEVLYVGNSVEFDSVIEFDEEQNISARSNDQEKHIELKLFANLKSFF